MQLYDGALERLEGGVGWSSTGRKFRALLLVPGASTFNAADAVIDDVLDHVKNVERTAGHYGRSPVLFDSVVVGVDIRQLRFAVADGVSQNAFRDHRTGDVVIYEVVTDDTDSAPLAFLSASETLSLVDGGKAIYELPEIAPAAWASVVPDSVQPYLPLQRVEVVLDHAGILALSTPLELMPTKDGIAYYIESVAVSHPEWDESYEATDSPNLRFSGAQELELSFDAFGTDPVLSVVSEAEEVNLIEDVGQPLTVSVPIPFGVAVDAEISGTAPAGTNSIATPLDSETGTNAFFNVSWTGGVYTLDSIFPGGSGYQVGDIVVLNGSFLSGGASPANDLTIEVTAIEDGVITGGAVGQELRIAVDYTEKTL